MKVTKIANNIYTYKVWIRRGRETNSFLFPDREGVTVVDCGYNRPETLEELAAALEEIGFHIYHINRFYATHLHSDHVGLAGEIHRLSGCRVYLPQGTEQPLQDIMEGRLPEQAAFFCRAAGMRQQQIDENLLLQDKLKKYMPDIPLQAVSYFAAGETLTLGGQRAQVVQLAGHARQQLGFFLCRENILLCGDSLLPDIVPDILADRQDFSYHPLPLYVSSLHTIANCFAGAKVYGGHGDRIETPKAAVANALVYHEKRLQKIWRAVAEIPEEMTLMAVMGKAYNAGSPFTLNFAMLDAMAHLLHLEDMGFLKIKMIQGVAYFRKGSVNYRPTIIR